MRLWEYHMFRRKTPAQNVYPELRRLRDWEVFRQECVRKIKTIRLDIRHRLQLEVDKKKEIQNNEKLLRMKIFHREMEKSGFPLNGNRILLKNAPHFKTQEGLLKDGFYLKELQTVNSLNKALEKLIKDHEKNK